MVCGGRFFGYFTIYSSKKVLSPVKTFKVWQTLKVLAQNFSGQLYFKVF